jgi:predicted DNA binding CopG/RHH family protein
MKNIPKFSSEDEEREFWATADSTDYIDWKRGRRMLFPKLRPSVKTILLRLPETMLEELKLLANKRDVPYQSLLKMFLSERIEQELKSASSRREKVQLRPEAGGVASLRCLWLSRALAIMSQGFTTINENQGLPLLSIPKATGCWHADTYPDGPRDKGYHTETI